MKRYDLVGIINLINFFRVIIGRDAYALRSFGKMNFEVFMIMFTKSKYVRFFIDEHFFTKIGGNRERMCFRFI